MSKNFELLQEIGSEEELFRTSAPLKDAVSEANGELDAESAKAARDRILQTASLPNVFQTSDEPSGYTPALTLEQRVHLDEDSDQKTLQDSSTAAMLRPSRNARTVIGSPATSPITSNDPRWSSDIRQDDSPFNRPAVDSQKAHEPEVSVPRPHPELWIAEEKRDREGLSRSSPSAIPAKDAVKVKASSWKRKPPSQSKLHVEDLHDITREEEIKLIQRVFPGTEHGSPRVAVFSALGNESACAAICARAAEILAARGEGPVCVVDSNFASPSLHQYFGVDYVKGLAEAAIESGPIREFVQQIPDSDLWLLPSGKTSKQFRFRMTADGLRARITELRAAYSYVIIHAGPLHLETSAMSISRWTDGVVLVVEANSTRRESAKRVKENLEAASVRLLGVVLNNRTFPIPKSIYSRL
jgi:Mrp family chromosome partitioning ATPase